MMVSYVCPYLQGKTLAFVLPILESLTNGVHKASRKSGYGRPPSVLVLLPTRELANQVSLGFFIAYDKCASILVFLYLGT